MEETYNYYIVALSVMIAILASYSSLNIAFKRKEGVENWEHIESLTQLGCNVMQWILLWEANEY